MTQYTERTNGIEISVIPTFIPKSRKPSVFLFTYEVSITNHTAHAVKLISRNWYISDAMNQIRSVTGEGVVGEQPIIDTGETYSYRSWSPIPTAIGRMWGFYDMVRLADGLSFKALIPEFKLIADFVAN